MNITLIETFLDLVQSGSLIRTANNLNVAQSTVSNRLSQLEEELNAVLFVRRRGQKGTPPTEKGSKFIPIAEEWRELFLKTEAWNAETTPYSLNVGSIETLNVFVFKDFYHDLISRNLIEHSFDLTIRTRIAEDLYTMLRGHLIDIGLTIHSMFFPNIDLEPLFAEEYRLICPKDRDFDPDNDIDLHKLELSREVYVPWERHFKAWHEECLGSTTDTAVRVDLMPLAEQYMQDGENWMLAPLSAAQHLAPRLNRQICPVKSAPPDRTCYLIKNKTPIYDRIHAQHVFEDLLKHYVKKLDFAKPL